MSERTMDRNGDVYGAAGLGTAIGWIGGQLAALWFALPAWMAQTVITVIISSATVTATHFLRRWLNRRWPDRHRRKGDTGD